MYPFISFWIVGRSWESFQSPQWCPGYMQPLRTDYGKWTMKVALRNILNQCNPRCISANALLTHGISALTLVWSSGAGSAVFLAGWAWWIGRQQDGSCSQGEETNWDTSWIPNRQIINPSTPSHLIAGRAILPWRGSGSPHRPQGKRADSQPFSLFNVSEVSFSPSSQACIGNTLLIPVSQFHECNNSHPFSSLWHARVHTQTHTHTLGDAEQQKLCLDKAWLVLMRIFSFVSCVTCVQVCCINCHLLIYGAAASWVIHSTSLICIHPASNSWRIPHWPLHTLASHHADTFHCHS